MGRQKPVYYRPRPCDAIRERYKLALERIQFTDRRRPGKRRTRRCIASYRGRRIDLHLRPDGFLVTTWGKCIHPQQIKRV